MLVFAVQYCMGLDTQWEDGYAHSTISLKICELYCIGEESPFGAIKLGVKLLKAVIQMT